MYAIFNASGNFIGYTPDKIPGVTLKEIPEHQRDLTQWKWVGGSEEGYMVSIYEKNYPSEDLSRELELFKIIEKNYPLDVQLTLIIHQLDILASRMGLVHNQFKEMADIILEAVEKKNNRLNYYIENRTEFTKNE